MSDEDILTGGETASAPTDIPAAPPPASEEAVTQGRDTVLSQLAKKEDISELCARARRPTRVFR